MPKRILVVDDSLDLIGAYREVLEEQGYSVTTASGGDEALAMLRRERPDLLITDIFMTGMDGLELISRVRRELPTPHLPIVAVSGMKAAREEALKRGADAFALKPLDYDVLVSLTRNGLSRTTPAAHELTADTYRRASRELAEVAVESYLANEPNALDGIRRLLHVISRFYDQPRAMLLWSSHGEIIMGGTSDATLIGKPVPEAIVHIAQSIIECGSSLVVSRGSMIMSELFGSELRFVVGVPLMLNGMSIGVMVMVDDKPRMFTAIELRLLEQVGTRAAQIVGRVASGQSLDVNGLALREMFLNALGSIMQWTADRRQVLGLATARFAESLPHTRGLSMMLELPPRSLAGNLGRKAGFFTVGPTAGAVRERLASFRTEAARLGEVKRWSQLVLDQPLPPLSAVGLIDWCAQLGDTPSHAMGLELAEVPLSPSP